MRVVINGCYGGYSLSEEAFELYLERKGLKFRKEKSEHFSLIGYEYYSENGFYLVTVISNGTTLFWLVLWKN